MRLTMLNIYGRDMLARLKGDISLKVGEREEEEMGERYRDWVKIGKYETCYMKFGK